MPLGDSITNAPGWRVGLQDLLHKDGVHLPYGRRTERSEVRPDKAGASIGIGFGTALHAADAAGVIVRSHWNMAKLREATVLSVKNLLDEQGKATTAAYPYWGNNAEPAPNTGESRQPGRVPPSPGVTTAATPSTMDSFRPAYTLLTFKPTTARQLRLVLGACERTSAYGDVPWHAKAWHAKDSYLFATGSQSH